MIIGCIDFNESEGPDEEHRSDMMQSPLQDTCYNVLATGIVNVTINYGCVLKDSCLEK